LSGDDSKQVVEFRRHTTGYLRDRIEVGSLALLAVHVFASRADRTIVKFYHLRMHRQWFRSGREAVWLGRASWKALFVAAME
jgi:hypothetical protein